MTSGHAGGAGKNHAFNAVERGPPSVISFNPRITHRGPRKPGRDEGANDMPQYITLAFLALFNGTTIFLLRSILRQVDYKSMLQEKEIASGEVGKTPESYSRVAGMLGAVLMVTLFWGASNVILFYSLERPDAVSNVVSGVGTFLVYGASLFLPYAANQLKAMFQKS